MKTRNIFKVLMTLAIALVVNVSIMAQNPPAPFAVYDANETAPTAIDSVTIGMTMPYYVLPDAYYHPSYVATGALTAGFTWTWSFPTNPSSGSVTSQTDNYVEITWGAVVGSNVVNVFETADAAYGGCAGDVTVMNVDVIAEPTMDFEPTAAGFIGSNIEVCEGVAQLADIIQVNLTGPTPFNVIWNFEIATLDASRAKDEWFDTDKTTNYAIQTYAVDNDAAAPDNVTVTAYELTRPDDGIFDCIGGKSTVYTYTITGVNDKISRKSDYMLSPVADDDFNYWDNTGANNVGAIGNAVATVEIIVNPAPNTGPIYHIPNNWAE